MSRGFGDLVGEAREQIDGPWGDHRDGPMLHSVLDTFEDYFLMHEALTAADFLRAAAGMEDDPAVRDLLRDLADATVEEFAR